MEKVWCFLREEEQGSATLWNLCWLMAFGAIMGLAIDTTGAMHTKAKMQAVADASAHAGVVDIFPFATEAYPAAVTYGAYNTSTVNVVRNQDITLGHWDDATRSFNADPNTAPYYNAVRVDAARNTSRANALATTLMKFAGLRNWDIRTAAIARVDDDVESVDRCRHNGFTAGGELEQTSNNIVTNLCFHGEDGFKMTQNNVVTCDVQLSTSDPSNWQTGGAPAGSDGTCDDDYANLSNDEMINQAFHYRSLESTAEREYDNVKEFLDAFVAGTPFNDPFVNTIPSYIDRVEVLSLTEFNNRSKVAGGSHNLVPGTLYKVFDCGGAIGQKLKLEGIVQNIGVYTDCEINVVKNVKVSDERPTKTASGVPTNCNPDNSTCSTVDWDIEVIQPNYDCAGAVAAGFEIYATLPDTVAGRTYRDAETVDTVAQDCGIEPGANGLLDNVFIFSTIHEDGNRDQNSITFPNNMQIGRLDGCTEGGGVRMYLGGSMSTPSGTIIHGAHIIALGDVKLAAKASGTYGVTIDAADDITYAAQGSIGGCPAGEERLASDIILTVRPIGIVD